MQINAKVLPENADNTSVVWSLAQGNEFATISETGLLTGNAPGQAVVRIEAADGSGVYGEYVVDIIQLPPTLVEKISLSADKDTIEIKETLKIKFEISPSDADNRAVIWSITEGKDIADVDGNGKLTAKASGKVTVRATAADESGVYGEITITVNKPLPVKVTSVEIAGGKDICIGDSLTLTAKVLPENAENKNIKWSIVSGSEYATITDDGVLKGIKAGKVTVKAEAEDGSGKNDTVTVNVKPISVASVKISGKTEMYVGETLTLDVTVLPENATNKKVSWSITSGSSLATVSDGVLTAIAKGTVKVRAKASDDSGVYDTITVTIKEKALWEGEGTESNPFLLKCVEDLLNLRKVLDKSGYHYLQVKDIDCSGVDEWVVIGDDDNPFRHHIDGGGYKISNICLDGDAGALFTRVEGSHFKNMNVVNAHTEDNHQTYENNTRKYPGNGGSTAAIVGYGVGCSFENCTATVNFKSSNSATGGLIGAVVLKNEKYTLMKNCHVSGTITGSGYVGGLIGNISTSLSDGDYQPAHTITIENCSADVEIIIFTKSSEAACVGGLIGKSFGVKVVNCHAKGSINVVDGDIGGLIGDAGNYTDVTRCYADVDIYVSSDDHYSGVSAGGLIGHIYSRSDVYDCYATGDINAPYVEWSPCQDSSTRNGGPWRRYYNPCGSLIGTLEVFRAYSEDQKIMVYNCYATGIVNVPNICEDERVYCHGALIGLVLDRYTVSNVIDKTKKDQSSWDGFSDTNIGKFGNNYNIENLRTYYTPLNDYAGKNLYGMQNPKYTAMPTHEYVEIITADELLQQSTFEGWDFQNVWEMTDNGPVLR